MSTNEPLAKYVSYLSVLFTKWDKEKFKEKEFEKWKESKEKSQSAKG